ncbi:hypothetical protein FRB95_010741 [Tulasnella sp. JGI-2019a]|nr:hypothetical protein FRB95_010741 [Tulasnella sp. JGI-2019a]
MLSTELNSLTPLLLSDASQRGSITVYTFTNDNPNKTQLVDDSLKRVVYDVRVDFEGKRPITFMRHLNADGSQGEIFGQLEWHDFFPDQMTFKGSKKVKKTSFFSKAGMFGVSFKDDQGRKYTWKGLGAGLQLQLHADDNFNPNMPIAQFQRTRRDYSTQPATVFPAMLFMTPRGVEIKELVIFTFLVLEKVRRTDENSTTNKLEAENLGGGPLGGMLKMK